MLLPVSRLLFAWLVQPSSADMLKEYDRACALLPFLREETAAAATAGAVWAQQLRSYERLESDAPPPASGWGSAPGIPTPETTDETMAELFSRIFPRDGDAAQLMERLARQQQQQQQQQQPTPAA